MRLLVILTRQIDTNVLGGHGRTCQQLLPTEKKKEASRFCQLHTLNKKKCATLNKYKLLLMHTVQKQCHYAAISWQVWQQWLKDEGLAKKFSYEMVLWWGILKLSPGPPQKNKSRESLQLLTLLVYVLKCGCVEDWGLELEGGCLCINTDINRSACLQYTASLGVPPPCVLRPREASSLRRGTGL